MRFVDRADAGRRLAAALRSHQGTDVVVVGLPRGGVAVAAEVARELDAPLDVIVVRKLGVPTQPELAMGAIGEGGSRVLDREIVRASRVTDWELATVEAAERVELERLAQRLREVRPRIDLSGRTVLVVDDGLATGSTARAACQVARAKGARRIVLAVPVAPADAAIRLGVDADEVAVLSTPQPFYAVGQAYETFGQVPDRAVEELLSRWRERPEPGRTARPGA